MTLRIEQELLDVTMIGGNWKYDPDWTYTDAAGHHHWRGKDDFPTLVWVVDDVHFHDGDECVDGHLACSLCWQPIEPGMVPAPSHVAGVKRFYLDGKEISYEQAETFLSRAVR